MLTAITVLASLAVCACGDPLGPYTIDPSSVTVGGLSAGAFMAVQYHMAHSSTISGNSAFAGGPWYCAQGSESTAITTCMNPLISKPNPTELADKAKTAAGLGLIDPIANIADAKVFLYSGSFDTVVHRPVMVALEEFYKLLVNSTGTITTSFDVPSEHCYPTPDFGERCAQMGSPYIGKCNYDGAGAALKTLYPDLAAKGTAVAANLMDFDQTTFATGHSLGTKGYVYVPTSCQSGTTTCKLHVSFHGCEQTLADVQTDYVSQTGLNDWAESNNIVVLYPQVSRDILAGNPEGCWDWWGYAGADYAYKTGKQIAFTKAIVDKLMGNSA